MKIIYELFRDKVRHIKLDRKITNADIAKMTGCYKESTIHVFMTGGKGRDSEAVAKAIARALDIEL
ncbi:MAG: hypothetical protein GX488_11635 [Clostridiales bacterium]|nr:hypothetical protein [Clostridiales bacterium]